MCNITNIQEQIRIVMDTLEQLANSLKVVGRELTPEEIEQIRKWEGARSLLDQALRLLEEETLPVPIPSSVKPMDGRFVGGNHEIYIELRIDETVSGVISADIFRNTPGGRDYVASIRTTPGKHISKSQPSFLIIGEDKLGNMASGTLALGTQSNSDQYLSGTLFLESSLEGLPSRRDIHFSAEWESEYLRAVGIELEREINVTAPPEYDFNGTNVTVESSLRMAGIDVVEVGDRSIIPYKEDGWATVELHDLMENFAQAPLSKRAWELHLLWLSQSKRDGLLGIMFDDDQLPRQGAAVFATEIRDLVAHETERKLIQTTVHELGHALNLAHRFERVVGRADSISFMNYDWRYKGGNRKNEYWSNFKFTFDSDELEFLRHAPRPALIPGGAQFHTINYWADGNGGYSPYMPEVPLRDFELTLSPPLNGPVFAFAQPVFLQIELKNVSGETINVPGYLLDPKAGYLEILVRRISSGTPEDDSAYHFRPVMERCFDLSPETMDYIPHNETMTNNLNITFGSGGFTFAEPGEYEITAVLAIPNWDYGIELVTLSNTLTIRVGYPRNEEDERDALVLFRNDVGLYFALGGSDGLSKAYESLEEVRQRRQGKAKTVRDPIVANIIRCAGINAGRSFSRMIDGKFITREKNLAKSTELLGQLDSRALQAFDAHTAKHTKLLEKKYQKELGK
jgi:hypothetical protein